MNYSFIIIARCHAVPLMFACAIRHRTLIIAHLAVHIPDICTALAGCMYDPVIPVHCTARVSLWQPLWINWSVPIAPVRRAGQRRGVKMSLRSRESVSHYKTEQQESESKPWWT